MNRHIILGKLDLSFGLTEHFELILLLLLELILSQLEKLKVLAEVSHVVHIDQERSVAYLGLPKPLALVPVGENWVISRLYGISIAFVLMLPVLDKEFLLHVD